MEEVIFEEADDDERVDPVFKKPLFSILAGKTNLPPQTAAALRSHKSGSYVSGGGGGAAGATSKLPSVRAASSESVNTLIRQKSDSQLLPPRRGGGSNALANTTTHPTASSKAPSLTSANAVLLDTFEEDLDRMLRLEEKQKLRARARKQKDVPVHPIGKD